jgi:integrase
VALSLKTSDFASAVAVGRILSTAFEGWMASFRMLPCLHNLGTEDFKALVQWAAADLRDVYAAQIQDPQLLPDDVRAAHVKRLRDEAAVLQSCLHQGDFQMLEGLAASLLRRRSIRFDFGDASFAAFVRAVTPTLIDARVSEIIRLDFEQRLGWRKRVLDLDTPEHNFDNSQSANMRLATTTRPTPEIKSIRGRTIGECLDGCLVDAARAERLREKTASQYRQTARMVIGHFGDIPAAAISRAMAAEFKEIVLRLPSKHGQSSRYAGQSLVEAVATADRLRDAKRVSANTWNRHQVALKQIWDHAVRHGYAVENVFDGVRIAKRRSSKRQNEERERFGRARLSVLFHSPVFTGMLSRQLPHKPGNLIERNARYWVPLIAISTGMRREEIAQLRRRDLEAVGGILCFRVRDGEGQSIKSASARRDIPVPETIDRLGFLDFVGDLTERPNDLLFGDCRPVGKERKYGEVVGKWFGRYLRHIGIKTSGLTFHSLRHDFASEMHAAGVEAFLIDYLMGHSTRRLAFDRYSSGIEPALKIALDKLDAVIGGLVSAEKPSVASGIPAIDGIESDQMPT